MKIGFVGLGVMGKPMASHLLAKGYPLVVHSRSRGPVDALVAAGAVAAASPVEVARQSDVVITMLPDTPDVEAVLTGPDGVIAGLAKGGMVIDMSAVDGATNPRALSTSPVAWITVGLLWVAAAVLLIKMRTMHLARAVPQARDSPRP
ncbi:MAG: hypothetical protein EXQ49_00330 [Acidobacteria bacterium]|nr:hypothetical protein [Acidobacteriota bacterium]